jgi:hypothetical protein
VVLRVRIVVLLVRIVVLQHQDRGSPGQDQGSPKIKKKIIEVLSMNLMLYFKANLSNCWTLSLRSF